MIAKNLGIPLKDSEDLEHDVEDFEKKSVLPSLTKQDHKMIVESRVNHKMEVLGALEKTQLVKKETELPYEPKQRIEVILFLFVNFYATNVVLFWLFFWLPF